eukprot:11345684-Alexandrium_andersonii.AAC.1
MAACAAPAGARLRCAGGLRAAPHRAHNGEHGGGVCRSSPTGTHPTVRRAPGWPQGAPQEHHLQTAPLPSARPH